MSYELKKPFSDFEKSDFIVTYNRNQKLNIVDTDLFLFALEDNEIMGEKEIETVIIDPETGETHTETLTVPYPVINPNYEEEQAQKEQERLSKLSLTKREVFLALYRAKEITPDMLKAQIQDTEALIEFEYANDYYRGNPLIDTIGGMLNYTAEDLNYLFENKEFPKKRGKK